MRANLVKDQRSKEKSSESFAARLARMGLSETAGAEPPVQQPAYETIRLIAEIESWEWEYFLDATNRSTPGEWRREEFRHLLFFGNLIRPTRFKLRKIRLTLIPTGPEIDGARSGNSIGHLGRSRSQWKPQISIPATALSPILTVADRLKFFILEVNSDVIKSAEIRSFSLRMTVDDEELQER